MASFVSYFLTFGLWTVTLTPQSFPIQKTETQAESTEAAQHPQPVSTEKVVQETVLVEERFVKHVHASGDASHVAGDDGDAAAQVASADASGAKGKDGSALTEGAKEEKGEVADQAVLKPEEMATASHEPEEEPSAAIHISETLEPPFEVTSPVAFSTKVKLRWDSFKFTSASRWSHVQLSTLSRCSVHLLVFPSARRSGSFQL